MNRRLIPECEELINLGIPLGDDKLTLNSWKIS